MNNKNSHRGDGCDHCWFFGTIVDTINERLGNICDWLVLLACIVSGGNAMVRYAYDQSSNAWLRSAVVHVRRHGHVRRSYTLKRNEHVRVDLFYMTLSRRGQLWVDILGTLFFLLPTCAILAWLSWRSSCSPRSASISSNAGGLIRWPIKLVLPVGFRWWPCRDYPSSSSAWRSQRGCRSKASRRTNEADAMILSSGCR